MPQTPSSYGKVIEMLVSGATSEQRTYLKEKNILRSKLEALSRSSCQKCERKYHTLKSQQNAKKKKKGQA